MKVTKKPTIQQTKVSIPLIDDYGKTVSITLEHDSDALYIYHKDDRWIEVAFEGGQVVVSTCEEEKEYTVIGKKDV